MSYNILEMITSLIISAVRYFSCIKPVCLLSYSVYSFWKRKLIKRDIINYLIKRSNKIKMSLSAFISVLFDAKRGDTGKFATAIYKELLRILSLKKKGGNIKTWCFVIWSDFVKWTGHRTFYHHFIHYGINLVFKGFLVVYIMQIFPLVFMIVKTWKILKMNATWKSWSVITNKN